MQSTKSVISPWKIFSILGLSVGLGVAHDYLFFSQKLGLNFSLFIALFIIGYFLVDSIMNKNDRPMEYRYLFYAGFAVLFGFFVVWRDSYSLTMINVLMSLFMIILLIRVRFEETLWDMHLSDYFFSLFEIPMMILVNFIDYIATIFGLGRGFSKHKNMFAILRGIVIAIPFLIIFLILFASADLIFGKMIFNFFSFKTDVNFVGHFIDFLFISALSCGTFFLLTSNYLKKNKEKDVVAAERVTGMNSIEISVVLTAINALFLLFIAIQVTYLFGGAEKVIEAGFTYSEYARKGFFELLVVAVISFFLLYGADRMMKKLEAQKNTLYRVVASLLSLQVLVIMVSSFYRLLVYENAYGFTELRFYSHSFTIWLGVVFALFIYKLNVDRHEKRFAFNVILSLIIYVFALNIANPDNFIVRQNIDRYSTTGKLDTYYWAFLSFDAVPAIIDAQDRFSDDINMSKKIEQTIYEMDRRLDVNTTKFDWRSFQMSDFLAEMALMD